MAGIVFGTKATLSKNLYDDLVITGTLHIVALSGMNITIIAGLISKMLLPIVSRRAASLITIVFIILFVLLVGPAASIIRAAIMGIIGCIAISLGRQQWSLYSLVIAVALMVLLVPSWMLDISFQLSVLATLGIILFATGPPGAVSAAGPLPGRLLLWIRMLIDEDLRVTLAAQVFTIPLIFFHFHRISIISPLSNILIGWTIAPLTIFGWVVSILGLIWLPLGQMAAWASWVFLEYLIVTISMLARVPFSSVGFY